jgi:aminoglycoside phosphotransferase (APT) family kinase protein
VGPPWERSLEYADSLVESKFPVALPTPSIAISAQPSEPNGELLSTDTVGAYLTERGVFPATDAIAARQLDGGVSNVVLAADSGARAVVVKQALPRLRVPQLWLAKRERAISEADALVLAATITPGVVPAVLDLDRDRCALTISAAPRGWSTWKSRLLAGDADPAVASRVGAILGAWHRATFRDQGVAARFADYEAFDQLRVDPFYRTVAQNHPELAQAIDAATTRMEATHICLVHGDYSPKNVLVGDGVWVIDFEVAHFGDPAFDVAFMLNHLLLKLVHVPRSGAELGASANCFWNSYRTAVPAELLPDIPYLLAHVGALMVARVDGKSPAEYLARPEQDIAREAGSRLLLEPPDSLGAAIEVVRRVLL